MIKISTSVGAPGRAGIGPVYEPEPGTLNHGLQSRLNDDLAGVVRGCFGGEYGVGSWFRVINSTLTLKS